MWNVDPIIRVFKKKFVLVQRTCRGLWSWEDEGSGSTAPYSQPEPTAPVYPGIPCTLCIQNPGIPWTLCIQVYLEPCVSRYTLNPVYRVYLEPCVSRYTLNPLYPGIPWTVCIQLYHWSVCIKVYLKPCVSRYTLNPVFPGIPWTPWIQVYIEPRVSRYSIHLYVSN